MMERFRRLGAQSTSDENEKARTAAPKAQSQTREPALDLAQVNSKLKNFADSSGTHQDQGEPEGLKDDAGTASKPPEHGKEPEGAGSSDFAMFLQQAAEEERQRDEDGRGTKPQLNQFYSNDWPDPSPRPPKLAEIQEAGDEEDSADISPAHRSARQQQQQQQPPETQTSSSASSGSHDFASAPDTRPTLTQTWPGPGGKGRHVSFSEPPPRARERSESNPNPYHARCAESPQGRRAMGRPKSFRQMVVAYVRQHT